VTFVTSIKNVLMIYAWASPQNLKVQEMIQEKVNRIYRTVCVRLNRIMAFIKTKALSAYCSLPLCLSISCSVKGISELSEII
jgi:hypothetical protein